MYYAGMAPSLTDWPSRSRILDHGFAAFAHSRPSRTWHDTRLTPFDVVVRLDLLRFEYLVKIHNS